MENLFLYPYFSFPELDWTSVCAYICPFNFGWASVCAYICPFSFDWASICAYICPFQLGWTSVRTYYPSGNIQDVKEWGYFSCGQI